MRITGAEFVCGELFGFSADQGEQKDLRLIVDVADESDLFAIGAPGGLSGVFLGGELNGLGLSAEICQPELVDVVEFFSFWFDGGDYVNNLFAIGADRDRPDRTDLGEVGDLHGLGPGLGQHRQIEKQEDDSDPTHVSGIWPQCTNQTRRPI